MFLDIVVWLSILFGSLPLLIAIATVITVIYYVFLKPPDKD